MTRKEEEAMERLRALAREAAAQFLEDNEDADIQDVALDLAKGLVWSAQDDWRTVLAHYLSEVQLSPAASESLRRSRAKNLLVRALAEEMT